jgi:hypothetical protein
MGITGHFMSGLSLKCSVKESRERAVVLHYNSRLHSKNELRKGPESPHHGFYL